MSMMIVDDHPLARTIIHNLLDINDITMTTELNSGDQVVQTVEKAKLEPLIIDVDISGISGIEVLEQLRKRHYVGAIIIISAKNEFLCDKHNTEHDANGLVSKKGGTNNILAAIGAARNGYSYFPFSLEHSTSSPASEQDKLDTLSNQEMRALCYILNGMDYSTIASKMNISNKAVSTYKSRLMGKLGCSSLIEIYDCAQRNKIG